MKFLPSQEILKITHYVDNIQPSSLDVTIRHDLTVKRNEYAYITINEKLPQTPFRHFSARSSLARSGVIASFDFKHNQIKIQPYAFDMKFYAGQRLGQIMFSNDTIQRPHHTQTLHNGLRLGLLEAKQDAPLLEFLCECDYKDYFKVITNKSEYTLEKGKFYLMVTKENICIPIDRVGLLQMESHNNPMIVHTGAGLFDSGFDGSGVLEIIPQQDVLIKHGQEIAKLDHYDLTEPTLQGYVGYYQGQDNILRALPSGMK